MTLQLATQREQLVQSERVAAWRELARRLRIDSSTKPPPFCLIAGGETTVRVKGKGRGGRNQELPVCYDNE